MNSWAVLITNDMPFYKFGSVAINTKNITKITHENGCYILSTKGADQIKFCERTDGPGYVSVLNWVSAMSRM
jgi:hypothetical protein